MVNAKSEFYPVLREFLDVLTDAFRHQPDLSPPCAGSPLFFSSCRSTMTTNSEFKLKTPFLPGF
jgi:hypothetical protein